MFIKTLRKWSILILATVGLAVPQYPIPFGPMMPMFQHQPMVMAPPPPPIPLPIPIGIPISIEMRQEDETTTTTTKKPSSQFKLIVPMFPFGFPNAINSNISQQSNLSLQFSMPVPIPMPAPSPIIMVPIPNVHIVDSNSDSDDSDSDLNLDSVFDSDSDSDESQWPSRDRYGIFRRSGRSNKRNSRGNGLKPVLSYIADNGEVKLRRELSSRDAELLLEEEKEPTVQKVQFVVNNDSNDKSRIRTRASTVKSSKVLSQSKNQIVIRRSSNLFDDGHKELVFKPPGDKKISNFSVSFHVSK